MSKENPTWGAPRIESKLRLLGYDVAESTVAKYLFRPTKLPSQTWHTFLDNHLSDLVDIDFFTVPLPHFESCTVSSSSATIAVEWSTSTSRRIPRHAERLSRSRKRFPGMRRRRISSGIAMAATARTFKIVWRTWALKKFSPHPDRLGRTPTVNA